MYKIIDEKMLTCTNKLKCLQEKNTKKYSTLLVIGFEKKYRISNKNKKFKKHGSVPFHWFFALYYLFLISPCDILIMVSFMIGDL